MESLKSRGSLIKAEESIKNRADSSFTSFRLWSSLADSRFCCVLSKAAEFWRILSPSWRFLVWNMGNMVRDAKDGAKPTTWHYRKEEETRFDSHWIINHFWIFNILIWSICTTRIFQLLFDLLTLFSFLWPRCCDTIKLLIWLLSNIVGSWWGHLNLLSI